MDSRDKVGVAINAEEGQVAKELRMLGEEIEGVDGVTSRLIERLQPTLAPDYPMPEDCNVTKEAMEISALAQELKTKRNRLASISRAVENTIERLEL